MACIKLWTRAVCLVSQSSKVDVWRSCGQMLNFGIYPFKDSSKFLSCHQIFTKELSWRGEIIKTCRVFFFWVKEIEIWVSSSEIIQMEAPLGWEEPIQRVRSNYRCHLPLAFLVYQKKLLALSMIKINNDVALIMKQITPMLYQCCSQREKEGFSFLFWTHSTANKSISQVRQEGYLTGFKETCPFCFCSLHQ